MKKLSYLFLFLLFTITTTTKVWACDEATVSIASIVDNMNGTFTVTYNVCVEFYGLEGNPYGWTFNYNNPNTIVVQSFTPPTITDLDGDVYTGTIRDGNCDAQGDGVYGACDGTNNMLQYYFPGFLPTNNGVDTLCFSVTQTIVGYPTSVDIITNIDATSFGSCTKTLLFPSLPLCGVTAATAGVQAACSIATNTYTQEVTITYNNAPATGTLLVNGQSFPITSSPQTVTLTGLAADGNPVNVVTSFSDEPSCSLTQNALFTAPAACGCGADAGTISN